MESASPELTPVTGHSTLREYLADLWDRREFVRAMPRHELHAQNLDTALGNFWFLINPILLTGIYWLIFGVLLDVNRGADNYVTFLLIGVLLYRFFASTTVVASRAMFRNRGLVRSLYFPRAVIPLAVSLSSLYTLMPGLLVLFITAIVTGEVPDWRWLFFPAVVAITFVFVTGSILIFARLGHSFRDLSSILPHVTRLGFYASGVLYDPEAFTDNPAALALFDVNPLYQFISLGRWSIMEQDVSWWFWITAPAWALASVIYGFVYFWRAETTYGSER
ncbi:MAG: ABC transporter permease [Acidimicrobiales bacterium]